MIGRKRQGQKKGSQKRKDSNDRNHLIAVTSMITIILLIVGIIGILTLEHSQKKEQKPFSELKLVSPDKLPNTISIGKFYNATYELKSFEKNKTTYQVISSYELFRLYDITEGIYSCLGPYRHKVYLEWINDSNITFYNTTNHTTPIPNMMLKQTSEDSINWTDEHSFQFVFSKLMGNGSFIIFYSNRSINTSPFKIRINVDPGEVFFNGKKMTDLEVKRQNNRVRLAYSNKRLRFFFDRKELFSRPVDINFSGQYGFETKDLLLGLTQTKVQHLDRIDVPDKDNIWDFEIESGVLQRTLSSIRKKITKSVKLVRFYNESNEKTQDTVEINKRSNLQENTSNIITGNAVYGLNGSAELQEDNLSKKNHTTSEATNSPIGEFPRNRTIGLKSLAAFITNRSDTSTRINFWLKTLDTNDSLIPWNNVLINLTFKKPEMNATYNILIGNYSAISLTGSSIQTITQENNSSDRLYLRIFNLNFSDEPVQNLVIKTNNNKLNIFVNNRTFSIDNFGGVYNESISFYMKNTFNSIDSAIIKKDSEECSKDSYEFCYIDLKPNRYRPRMRETKLEEFAHIVTEKRVIPGIDHETNDSNVKEITQDENPSTPNSIPTNNMIFDGHMAQITNQSNYSLETTLIYLDGDGVINIGLSDSNNSIFNVEMDFKNKKIYFRSPQERSAKRMALDYNPKINWSRLSVIIRNNELLEVFINHKIVLEKRLDREMLVNKGKSFTYTTNKTYFEIRNINIVKDGHTISIPLIDDPCRLKSIYKGIIKRENITLYPGESRRFIQKFRINKFFDYGKIRMDVKPQLFNRSVLHTHFWLERK